MDFKSTIDLIIKDLNEASVIIDDLKKYPGVPVLQVELAKSKCKSAAEVISLLKTISEIIPAKDETIAEKPKKKEIEPVRIPSPPPEKKAEPAEPSKKTTNTSIFADKFIQPSTAVNDQVARPKNEQAVSDHLRGKPVRTLSEAIGINDRFLFISEIFQGNKDEYNQAITRLDKAENLEDAMAIILSYTGEMPENEAIDQLIDLIKRKLPADE
jgi:hypothetical protein